MSREYTADDIKVLGDIDHIKRRPGMYIGECLDPRQLISEIIDNAIDEVQAGFSSEFIVDVDTHENKYTVRDFGRGIPHGKKVLENGEEKEILAVLLTKSHSGGKFDNSSYNYSSGLNGLGMTITNALSKTMVITSHRDKKYVKATVHSSSEVELEYGKSSEARGTNVSFIPDKQYFTSVIIPLDFIRTRCKIASALGFKARLIVNGKEERIDSSIFDLMKEEKVSTYAQISPIHVISENGEQMKVAIKYTSETNDKYFGFTNLLTNSMGGTHVNELSKSIIAVWKELPKAVKQYKVTFNSDGGTKVAQQFIEEGKVASIPTNPKKNGYTFVEWQLNGKKYNFNNQVTKDITFINDSKSTSLDATLFALETLKEHNNIILILGGLDKKNDYSRLSKIKVSNLIVYGSISEKVKKHYKNSKWRKLF